MTLSYSQVERRLLFWYAKHEPKCFRSKEKACPVCGRQEDKIKPKQKVKTK